MSIRPTAIDSTIADLLALPNEDQLAAMDAAVAKIDLDKLKSCANPDALQTLSSTIESAVNKVFNRYKQVLLAGFDQNRDLYPVRASHFKLFNKWEQKEQQIVDSATGEAYCNDSSIVKRVKCAALFLCTPLIQQLALFLNSVNRTAKVATLAHFWYRSDNVNDSFKTRLCEFGKDILRVAFSPIISVGLIYSALYGVLSPYDGGKIYAALERVTYGESFLAPFFQPFPTAHHTGSNYHISST